MASKGISENTPLYDEEGEFESRNSFQSRRPSPQTNNIGSCVCSFFQVLILVVMMVVLGFQESRVSEITSQLEQQSELIRVQQHELFNQGSKLHDMNVTFGTIDSWEMYVTQHISSLERSLVKFNKTVTNAEVVDKLEAMEIRLFDMTIYLNETLHSMLTKVSSSMKTASMEIERELDLAQTDILERLGRTNNDLNDAVVAAKEEIQEEVASVRSSMDQYVQDTNSQFKAENDFLKYQLAGTFTLLGILIAIWHVTQHVRHMWLPAVQRRILAILWMVPVYGVTSWLSLVFPIARKQLSVIRDCYEAYAVYTFFAFLCEVLRGTTAFQDDDLALIHIIESNSKQNLDTGHGMPRPPLYCPCGLERYTLRMLSRAALRQCRLCLMQFVLLKPLLTLAPFLCTFIGVDYYDHSPLTSSRIPDPTSPMLYVMVISNVSVSLAFYGLVSFYHLVDHELLWVDPWPKFLCIKGVVFMTFWQGFGLNLCGQFGYIDDETAVSAQDFLICIEMFLASIAHFYIFPHGQWEPGYRERRDKELGQFRAGDNFAYTDFVQDVKRAGRDFIQPHPLSEDRHEEENGARRSLLLLEEGDENCDQTRLLQTGYGSIVHALDESDPIGSVDEGSISSSSSVEFSGQDIHDNPEAKDSEEDDNKEDDDDDDDDDDEEEEEEVDDDDDKEAEEKEEEEEEENGVNEEDESLNQNEDGNPRADEKSGVQENAIQEAEAGSEQGKRISGFTELKDSLPSENSDVEHRQGGDVVPHT